jgi:hypothetical protein
MASPDLDAVPATSDANSAKGIPVANSANIAILKLSRIGTADPTTPANGDKWVRSDTATKYLQKARENGVTVSHWAVDNANARHIAVVADAGRGDRGRIALRLDRQAARHDHGRG